MKMIRAIAAALGGVVLLLGLVAPASAVFEDQRVWGGTAGGSATALTLTIGNWTLTNNNGVPIRFFPSATNTGAATLNVSSTGAKNIYKSTPTGVAALTGGELAAGQIVTVAYDGTEYVLQTAPPVSIAGDFQNLVVTATGNATFTIAADAITVAASDGYANRIASLSVTCTVTNSGANGFDSGSPSSSSWISAWAIRNPGTNTNACLASASATSPTLPSGYTMKRRVGWLRYDGSSHLWRTAQYGRAAHVIVGTSPTTPPSIASGTAGAYTAASISSFVPSTADAIQITLFYSGGGGGAFLAPNSSYPSDSTVPLGFNTASATGGTDVTISLQLESSNVYWKGSSTTTLLLYGWEDNL